MSRVREMLRISPDESSRVRRSSDRRLITLEYAGVAAEDHGAILPSKPDEIAVRFGNGRINRACTLSNEPRLAAVPTLDFVAEFSSIDMIVHHRSSLSNREHAKSTHNALFHGAPARVLVTIAGCIALWPRVSAGEYWILARSSARSFEISWPTRSFAYSQS